MLKNLLETLIESIFTFRKVWIGNQAFPYQEYSFTRYNSDGQSLEIVSPVTGWARVQVSEAPSSGFARLRIVSFVGNTEVVSGSTLSTSNTGVFDVSLPVVKGNKFTVSIPSGFSYSVRYSKTMGDS